MIGNILGNNIISCSNFPKRHVGQTGRKLGIRHHDIKLATKRKDNHSLLSIHQDDHGHTFIHDALVNPKRTQEFNEVWL